MFPGRCAGEAGVEFRDEPLFVVAGVAAGQEPVVRFRMEALPGVRFAAGVGGVEECLVCAGGVVVAAITGAATLIASNSANLLK